MPITIQNQANISYFSNGVASFADSNIAIAELESPIRVGKHALDAAYRHEKEITYMLSMTNDSANDLSNVQIRDDLCSYEYQPDPASPPVTLTPMDYIGPSYLYLDGVYAATLAPTVSPNAIEYLLPTLAADTTAMIMFKAKVNEYAVLEEGSTMTNTMEVTAVGMAEVLRDSHTMPVENYAHVRIVKSMHPDDEGHMHYEFTLYNHGNLPANQVVLSDAFNPAIAIEEVYLDGIAVASTEYSYTGGLFVLPRTGAAWTMEVPPATYVRDALGRIERTAGTLQLRIVGTL